MKIQYHSFSPYLGYGVAAQGYIKILKANNKYSINWKSYNFNDNTIKIHENNFMEEQDLNFIHLTPEYIKKAIKLKTINLLNTVYETTKLPKEWKQMFSNIDKIAVPCTWNQNIFREELNRNIYYLPHLSQFHGTPATSEMVNNLSINPSTFVFLSVATWERRKNLEQLIHSFCKAFSSKDNVLLIIKTSKLNITQHRKMIFKNEYLEPTNVSLVRILRFKFNHAKIRLINDLLTETEMQSLYSRADAYITLSHGEGWGFGCYESAWYGKPVIATGFGGYLDFLNDDNAYLVPYKLIPYKPNYWDSHDRSTHQYAQPDLNIAIDMMREVFKNREKSKLKSLHLKSFVETNFNTDKINNYLSSFIHN